MTKPTSKVQTKLERQPLLAECYQMLEQIAQWSECLKLLEGTRISALDSGRVQVAAATPAMTQLSCGKE